MDTLTDAASLAATSEAGVPLVCENNRLTELPEFPKLGYLSCGHNQLTELPPFPELTTLFCQNNPLEMVPYYPKLTSIDLTGQPVAELMADPTDCGGVPPAVEEADREQEEERRKQGSGAIACSQLLMLQLTRPMGRVHTHYGR